MKQKHTTFLITPRLSNAINHPDKLDRFTTVLSTARAIRVVADNNKTRYGAASVDAASSESGGNGNKFLVIKQIRCD